MFALEDGEDRAVVNAGVDYKKRRIIVVWWMKKRDLQGIGR